MIPGGCKGCAFCRPDLDSTPATTGPVRVKQDLRRLVTQSRTSVPMEGLPR